MITMSDGSLMLTNNQELTSGLCLYVQAFEAEAEAKAQQQPKQQSDQGKPPPQPQQGEGQQGEQGEPSEGGDQVLLSIVRGGETWLLLYDISTCCQGPLFVIKEQVLSSLVRSSSCVFTHLSHATVQGISGLDARAAIAHKPQHLFLLMLAKRRSA